MLDKVAAIINTNFGDIDGMYDPNLESYFIDRNYWNKIVDNYRFFIIGRKGTGKSALYKWIKYTSEQTGNLCHNVLFNEFPFGKLLELKDDSFIKPNQYQTICKNMILSEFANIICSDAQHINNEYFSNLQYYNNIINSNSLEDCFRRSVTSTTQNSGELSFNILSLGKSNEKSEVFNFETMNLSNINTRLEYNIINYLKIYSFPKKFLIQIDGIDENYTQLSAQSNILDDYFQFVISLMKSTYTINQKLHNECADIGKCLIYLRSDIFFSIHKLDAESARWEQQTEYLNWAIQKGTSWENNDLRKLINTRFLTSIPALQFQDAFSTLFDPQEIHLTVRNSRNNKHYRLVTNLFEYIVNRTFHRPRDIIQFFIKIQDSIKSTNILSWKEFRAGEQEYSLWFLSEITNEISPNIKDTEALFTMLRNVGSKPLSISRFKSIYSKYQQQIDYDVMELLHYLYDLAVIYNINDNGEVFSSIRNDRSRLNPDIKICLHPGFWTGLYTSTF